MEAEFAEYFYKACTLTTTPNICGRILLRKNQFSVVYADNLLITLDRRGGLRTVKVVTATACQDQPTLYCSRGKF